MFEQAFKNIDDIIHKDAGCGSKLDFMEQTSLILFLRYLDDLEKVKKTGAELPEKVILNLLKNNIVEKFGLRRKLRTEKLIIIMLYPAMI